MRKLKSIAGGLLPIGQIVSVRDGEVSGWISGGILVAPVRLALALNGRVIDQQRIGRKQLLATDRVPFRFSVSPTVSWQCADQLSVSVRFIGRQLAGSPWRIRHTPLTGVSFGFLHIPKTAGTSLRMALETALGPDRVMPSQSYIVRRGGRYPGAQELHDAMWGVPSDVRLIQGHISLAELKVLAPQAKLLTVLRDPVDRSVSLLKHMKARQRGEVSYEELALDNRGAPWAGISNHQAWLLGGSAKTSAKSEASRQQDLLANAVAALEEMSVVGLTERYPETLTLCETVVGVALGPEKKLNRSDYPEASVDSGLLRKLRGWNALDIELYQEAKRIFSRQLMAAHDSENCID